MAFAVFAQEMDGLEQVILKDTNSETQVAVLPSHGALLHAFTIVTNEGEVNVIDNYKDLEALQNELDGSYKSSKLSPFACRIKDARYTFDGKQYEFEKKFTDGTAIHGLLYDKPFKVVNDFSDDSQASVQLKYNYNNEDAGYPFKYRCEVRYTLLPGNALRVETIILNSDDIPIPLADGWHPYFAPGGETDNWLLRFDAESMVEFDSHLLPTGQLMPYTGFNEERPIASLELDNCFVLDMKNGYSACTLTNPENKVSINFFPGESYPYLQIYTPPHRKSIAIENLSAAPDCFNNKMGLVLLSPGHSKTFTVTYKVTCG